MYTVSNRWEQNIRKGPSPVTKIDVLFPGEGVVFEDLPVISGSLTIARSASSRTSGTVVVGDPSLLPALNSGSPIAPYGAEILVKTGFRYYDGTEELIPMGIFTIWSVTGSEASGNIPSMEVYDRSRQVERTDHIAPKDYGGWDIHAAIEDVVLYAAPFYPGTGVEWSVAVNVSLGNPILPGGTILDGDRWAFVSELAASIGGEAYFDRFGNCAVNPIPAINTSTDLDDVAWSVDVGEDGILIDADHPINREQIYNAVLVKGAAGEDSTQPASLITDTDPASRTYFSGPFGKHVLVIEDDKLTLESECEDRARAELRNITGGQASVSFNAVANPALDPGDVLLMTYLDGTQELHMLDEYSYDFRTAAMAAQTRSVQYIPES